MGTCEPGPANTDSEGKLQEKQRIFTWTLITAPWLDLQCLKVEAFPLLLLLFQGACTEKRRNSSICGSLSRVDHGQGSASSTSGTIARALGFPQACSRCFKPPEQHACGAEGGNTLCDTSYHPADAVKSSLVYWTAPPARSFISKIKTPTSQTHLQPRKPLPKPQPR